MRRRLSKLAGPIAVLPIVVLGLGACVSPRDDDSGTTFAPQADVICRRIGQELNTLPKPKDAAGFRTYLTNVDRIERRILDGLGDLEQPEKVRDRLRPIFDLADDRVEVLGQLRVAARAEDETQTTQLSGQYQQVSADLEKQARGFGFNECFQDTRVAELLGESSATLLPPTTTISEVTEEPDDTVVPDETVTEEDPAADDAPSEEDTVSEEDPVADDAASGETTVPDGDAASAEDTVVPDSSAP